MQLLDKRRNEGSTYKLTENVLVKNAIKSCQGLPLAISVISGLNLQTDDGWQNVINTIVNKDLQAEELLPDYDFNVFATFKSSINQLNQRDQNLFRSLGVFKAVEIPVESIISLWGLQIEDINRDIVTTKLKMLHRRSLLNFVNEDRLV